MSVVSVERSAVSDIMIVSSLASFTFHGKRYSVKEDNVHHHNADGECQTHGAKLAAVNYIQEMQG